MATVGTILSKEGWIYECEIEKTDRFQSVDVAFINNEGNEDETEFEIKSFDKKELQNLWKEFCKENKLRIGCATAVVIVRSAETMKGLEE